MFLILLNLNAHSTGAQFRHNDFLDFHWSDPSRTFTYNRDGMFYATSRALMEKKCRDTHKVKIILVTYLFYPVIKVIAVF